MNIHKSHAHQLHGKKTLYGNTVSTYSKANLPNHSTTLHTHTHTQALTNTHTVSCSWIVHTPTRSRAVCQCLCLCLGHVRAQLEVQPSRIFKFTFNALCLISFSLCIPCKYKQRLPGIDSSHKQSIYTLSIRLVVAGQLTVEAV